MSHCSSPGGQLILAFDTASPWCSVALKHFSADDSTPELLGRFLSDEGTQSRLLPVVVKKLLDEAGLTLKDINLVAVGRGPGSFTGLRTGLALAKGLAAGAGLPVIGLGSLAAAAFQAFQRWPEAELVAPVIDARHSQVFTALYRRCEGREEGPMTTLAEPRPVAPEDLPVFLTQAVPGPGILLAGPALDLVTRLFPDGLPAPLAASAQEPPEASSLADLARLVYREDQAALNPPLPLYLRQPDIRKTGLALR